MAFIIFSLWELVPESMEHKYSFPLTPGHIHRSFYQVLCILVTPSATHDVMICSAQIWVRKTLVGILETHKEEISA